MTVPDLSEEQCQPKMISVVWDGPDAEVRALSAMLAILERSKDEGLDAEALHRVAAYVSDRFPQPPF